MEHLKHELQVSTVKFPTLICRRDISTSMHLGMRINYGRQTHQLLCYPRRNLNVSYPSINSHCLDTEPSECPTPDAYNIETKIIKTKKGKRIVPLRAAKRGTSSIESTLDLNDDSIRINVNRRRDSSILNLKVISACNFRNQISLKQGNSILIDSTPETVFCNYYFVGREIPIIETPMDVHGDQEHHGKVKI